MAGDYRPWLTDKFFLSIMPEREKTLIDVERLWMLYSFARSLNTQQGFIAEVGVYRGGSLKLIAEAAPSSFILGFDTFTGMPHADPMLGDWHRVGDFSDTDLETVRDYVGHADRVSLIQGVFPASMENIYNGVNFKFVHIDCDVYESVESAATFFYPRLIPGGVILFDDYGFDSCIGARRAVNDIFSDWVVYLPTGQALVVRT